MKPVFYALLLVVFFLVDMPIAYGHGHEILRPRIGQSYENFWRSNLSELFERKLFPQKHELLYISQRMKLLLGELGKRYGMPLIVSRVTDYHPASKLILFGANAKNGAPRIEIIMPAVIDVYLLLKKGGGAGWKKIFEIDMIISFFHELEHLAYGNENLDRKATPAELDKEEWEIWAITSEYTIGPLVEKYNVKLSKEVQRIYANWLQADRNKDSFRWKSFIKRMYSVTR